jgi:hypothetical protein
MSSGSVFVRGVRPAMKRQLEERAAALGLTQNEYVLRLIREDLARPDDASAAQGVDIARLIAAGGWPGREEEADRG